MKISLCLHMERTNSKESHRQLYEEFLELSKFYGEFNTWFKNKRPIKNGVIKPLYKDQSIKTKDYFANKLRDNLMIGTPSQIINRLKQYETLGYDEYSVWIANGMSFKEKKKFLKLFIDKVLPVFCD